MPTNKIVSRYNWRIEICIVLGSWFEKLTDSFPRKSCGYTFTGNGICLIGMVLLAGSTHSIISDLCSLSIEIFSVIQKNNFVVALPCTGGSSLSNRII